MNIYYKYSNIFISSSLISFYFRSIFQLQILLNFLILDFAAIGILWFIYYAGTFTT